MNPLNPTTTTTILLSGLFLIVLLGYLLVKIRSQVKIKNSRINRINNLGLTENTKEYFIELVSRTFTLYVHYSNMTCILIGCSVFSILFSVVSIVFSLDSSAQQIPIDDLSIPFSILSVFFVFIIIYIKPQQRLKQYIQAWRKIECHTLASINRLEFLTQGTQSAIISHREEDKCNSVIELAQYSVQFRQAIEESLTEDED